MLISRVLLNCNLYDADVAYFCAFNIGLSCDDASIREPPEKRRRPMRKQEATFKATTKGEMKRGKAKVSWDDVCLPKYEGGLGIRKLDEFNIALMSTHVWKILTHKETLWVKWIHTYKLKNRSFWDVSLCSNVSWGWRKLLSIRSTIRPFIWYKLGNGCKASTWFDTWDTNGPIMPHITNRAIINAGFTSQDCVADIVRGTTWKWPHNWFVRFQPLNSFIVPIIQPNQEDKLVWKTINGSLKDFSVSDAWHSIRTRNNEVDWYMLVWSKYGIPRHSIHLWLIMRRTLKTQDRLKQWDVGNDVNLNLLQCSLCKSQPDSHDHLFFECPFSSKVRNTVLNVAELPSISPIWDDIVHWILPLSLKDNVASIIRRLIVAASTYFIWQERNNQVHAKPSRDEDQVAKVIVDMVRSKLASIKFKNKVRVDHMKMNWKIA